MGTTGARERFDVVVVGAGQAGLSMSHRLKARGIDHVVLERRRVAHDWRERRWDSFCLVTPNWQCTLPGFAYPGPAPHGFMTKPEIVAYLEAYVASFDPPLREGVSATALRGGGHRPFELDTSEGGLVADSVVVATGGYHLPRTPRIAERLPEDILQLHSVDYRNPTALPAGDVLVVGTGQSGCQIAEDLHLAGRRVHLCVGGAPRTARRYRGKDVVEWLDALGHYRMSVQEHPLKERVRLKANHYVTGRDGGHDIDLRRFALQGMRLYGRLVDIRSGRLLFAQDLARNLDAADASAENIKDTIDKFIESRGFQAPSEPRYSPPWLPDIEPAELELAGTGIRTVIWATGFAPDYRWIELPAFDGKGGPVHERGVTAVPGLYFLGLPWQHTWGSGRFCGVGDDAEYLAERIQSQRSGREGRTRQGSGAHSGDSEGRHVGEPKGIADRHEHVVVR
jgi:putative flavoprotein involved in K+ transport